MLGTAGNLYRGEYRAYIAAICAPRTLGKATGAMSRCDGCLGAKPGDFCLCDHRKAKWTQTKMVLADTGASGQVDRVCLDDQQVQYSYLWLLQVGLRALAHHYGLTGGAKRPIGKYHVSSPVEP